MVKILESITCENMVLTDLIDSIKNRTLPCNNQVVVNGDHRFWGVEDNKSTIVRQFRETAIRQYVDQTGAQPGHIIIMANHISAQASPEGSGGGWHVDSVRNQYKLFMYLTDCTRPELGPLTLLSLHPLVDRIAIFINYLAGSKFRFTEFSIRLLGKLGFKPKPMLLQRLKPFFVNTSFIHRGAPITEGERIMLTAYIFDHKVPESIAKRALANGPR